MYGPRVLVSRCVSQSLTLSCTLICTKERVRGLCLKIYVLPLIYFLLYASYACVSVFHCVTACTRSFLSPFTPFTPFALPSFITRKHYRKLTLFLATRSTTISLLEFRATWTISIFSFPLVILSYFESNRSKVRVCIRRIAKSALSPSR